MRVFGIAAACLLIAFATVAARAQADDICREASGETPSREMGSRGKLAPYVYGRISLKGVDSTAPSPRVVAVFSDSRQPALRQTVGRSGSYCFKHLGTGGVLIVEVDGAEVIRKDVSDMAAQRQEEDFEVTVAQTLRNAPGVISATLTRQPNQRTADLYKKAAAAEANGQASNEIDIVRSIVEIDPEDYVAWAKLGSLFVSAHEMEKATDAFEHALKLKPDYTTALIDLGMIRAFTKDFPAAIELFGKAAASDPTSARAYRLLGEAYLQNRQGTLGLAALDKAIALDPVRMAECHLLKARLYDLAGAKDLASAEYRVYLKKVPDSPDRKKYEQYIKDNPEN